MVCEATSPSEFFFFLDESALLAGVTADGTASAGTDSAATQRHVLHAS